MKIITTILFGLFLFVGCIRAEVDKGFDFKFNDEVIKLPGHPRLFFPKDEEGHLRDLAKNEPLLGELIELLRQQAEAKLISPLPAPDGNGKALNGDREVSTMLTLSLAYRLFNDKRYAKRVEEALLNLCNYKSWNPENFLVAAELTTSVAIGYDWCFDELSPETRTIVAQAIREKGLVPAFRFYESGVGKFAGGKNGESNWNVVCNSSMVTGALAIAETYPEDAARIIKYAIQYVPNSIKHFAPEGVYFEGPIYWDYNWMYLMLLLDNLDRNLGSDFGLSKMPGVEQSIDYYIQTLSPSNRNFNFADGGPTDATYSPVYFFSSRYFDKPNVAEFYRNYLREAFDDKISGAKNFNFPRLFFLSIPWYDQRSGTDKTEHHKLKVYEGGDPDLLVFNGHAPNRNELYLIAKGGKPEETHNQLDVGSFVVESQQIRWGIDLRGESYSLPGFWNASPNGARWNYFINTNLAHNTLNIDGKIANSGGTGTLIKTDTESAQPFGIFDMSSSYVSQAASVQRGFKMLANDIILSKDEVVFNEGSKKLNWRFITDANVVNKGTFVELSKNGKTFYLYPLLQGEDEIKTFEAKTNSARERQLKGITVIEISVQPDSDKHAAISVLMGDDLDKMELKSKEKIPSLNEW